MDCCVSSGIDLLYNGFNHWALVNLTPDFMNEIAAVTNNITLRILKNGIKLI
jgi:hypothetical protein